MRLLAHSNSRPKQHGRRLSVCVSAHRTTPQPYSDSVFNSSAHEFRGAWRATRARRFDRGKEGCFLPTDTGEAACRHYHRAGEATVLGNRVQAFRLAARQRARVDAARGRRRPARDPRSGCIEMQAEPGPKAGRWGVGCGAKLTAENSRTTRHFPIGESLLVASPPGIFPRRPAPSEILEGGGAHRRDRLPPASRGSQCRRRATAWKIASHWASNAETGSRRTAGASRAGEGRHRARAGRNPGSRGARPPWRQGASNSV